MCKHCTNRVYCKLFGNLFHSLERHPRRLHAEPWHTLPWERIGILVWFRVCKQVGKLVGPQQNLAYQRQDPVLAGLELADLAIAAAPVVPVLVVSGLADLDLVVLVVAQPGRLLSIRVHTSLREHLRRL